MRHWLRAFLVFVGVAVAIPATGQSTERHPPAALPAVVVLVRHAEKALQPGEDPPLTAEGLQRAEALAATLWNAGVSAVITTQWVRTKQTAAPVAALPGVTSRQEVVPTQRDIRAHAEAVARAVRRHAGGAVLVVGHSNTIPAILAALGGPRLPDICDSAFDDLFVLSPAADGAHLVKSRYGPPSPRDACR